MAAYKRMQYGIDPVVVRGENTNNLFKSQDSLKNALAFFTSLGFSGKHVWEAWKNTNHRQNLMLDELIRLSQEQSAAQKKEDDVQIFQNQEKGSDESQIRQAIALSLKTQSSENVSEEFIRKESTPTGLINLGRTCYFNVVIQTLLSMKEIRNLLMSIDLQAINVEEADETKLGYMKLINEFQLLSGALLKGKKSWQNPSGVFESLRKLSGDCFRIGEENDFWEFYNCTFDILENSIKSILNIQKTPANVSRLYGCSASDEQLKINIDMNFFATRNGNAKTEGEEVESNREVVEETHEKKSKELTVNPITEMFFGTAQECITYADGQKEVKKFNESIQGILSLEVQHGDLYKALSAAQVFEIPDYEIASGGGKTMARVENKLKKSPEILNFYINRLDFDRKLLKTVKRNDSFYFEKTINLDNFTVSDDQLSEAASLSLEDQLSLEKIDRQIARIENYQAKNSESSLNGFHSTQLELGSSLDKVIAFLERQTPKTDEFTDLDDFELNLEESTGDFKIASEQELDNLGKLLRKYKDRVSSHTESLTQKLDALRKERARLYKKAVNANMYNIFSILMHEGKADSGHYYCYIYSEEQKKWFKYNDSIVTEAVEEELLLEAFGKANSTRNACCLFYRRAPRTPDVKEQEQEKQEKEIESGEVVSAEQETLPAPVQAHVDMLNKQFFKGIDKQRVASALEPFKIRMTNEINNRKALIAEVLRKQNDDNKLVTYHNLVLHLISFDTFLLHQDKNVKAQRLGEREILLSLLKQSDLNTLANELYGKQENLVAGFDDFFATFNGIGSYSQPLDEWSQAEYMHLKKQHNYLNAITNQLEKYMTKLGKTVEDYPELMTGLVRVVNSLQMNVTSDARNSSLYLISLLELAEMQLKAQLLKGTFHLDCMFSSESSTNAVIVLQSITQGFLVLDQKSMIRQQVISNLSHSMTTHGQNPRVFSMDSFRAFSNSINLVKQSFKTPNKLPNWNLVLYEGKAENVKENILNSPQDVMIFKSIFSKTYQINQQYLGTWIGFVQQIKSTGKLVSDENRLDKEEVFYALYL